MTTCEIKSETVRRAITGSCTPAQDLAALADEGQITPAEISEANLYFAYAGGLWSAVEAEISFAIACGI